MLELNKLYNGNCLKFMKSIDNNSIDLILTDPPYNCINKKNKDFYKNSIFDTRESFNKIYKFEEEFDFEKDMYLIIDEFNRIGKEFAYLIFFWNNITKISYVINYAKDKYKNHLRVGCFVWLKNNPIPRISKSNLLASTEYCSVIQKNKGKGHFNYYNYNFMHNYYISSSYIEDRKHPTQKPIKLIEKLIMIYSNENDIVLDPLAGSGTTIIGALNLNRKYIGIELEKEYYNIANERIKLHKQQLNLFNNNCRGGEQCKN